MLLPYLQKKLTLLLVLISSCLYSAAQDVDTVTLLKQRASATTDSARFDLTLALYNACFKAYPEQSRAYAGQMLTIAQENNDWQMKYLSYASIAWHYTKFRNYPYVFRYNSLAYQAAVKANKPEYILTSLVRNANAYIDAEHLETGFAWLQAARAFTAGYPDKAQQAKIAFATSVYYTRTNQHVQALEHYQYALSLAHENKNEKLALQITLLMTESMMELGRFSEASEILTRALEHYKRTGGSIYRQALIYSKLGEIQVINGIPEQGIRNYEKAGELYLRDNNTTDYALMLTDLCGVLMSRKQYGHVPSYLHLADSLLTLTNYQPGRVDWTLKKAQYLSETGSFVQADSFFSVAAAFARQAENKEITIALQQQLVSHYYRQNQLQESDSLMYAVASLISTIKEPEVTNRMLTMIEARNPGLDSQALRMLRLLYTPDGKKIENISGALPLQFFATLNPYTLAPDSFSREMTARYNQAFAEQAIQNKVAEISDSLKTQRYQTHLEQEKRKLSQRTAAFLATGLLLISIILGLVARDRRRQAQMRKMEVEKRQQTERDRQQMYNLYTHANHNASNHMSMLSSIVQNIKRSGDIAAGAADRLSQRIAVLNDLYDCLYTEDAPEGNTNLRLYLPKICSRLAALYADSADISARIEEDIWLKPRDTVILGSIIMELTVNSCKHAFSNEKGMIAISLMQDADKIILDYRDNGTGIMCDREGSRGITQIMASVLHLDGTGTFHNDNGLHFQLIFSHTLS